MGKAGPNDDHLGIVEYEISCMPCHGINGRGDGPKARTLVTPPADLTQIARSNGGAFPTKRIAEMIDGRSIVGTHG